MCTPIPSLDLPHHQHELFSGSLPRLVVCFICLLVTLTHRISLNVVKVWLFDKTYFIYHANKINQLKNLGGSHRKDTNGATGIHTKAKATDCRQTHQIVASTHQDIGASGSSNTAFTSNETDFDNTLVFSKVSISTSCNTCFVETGQRPSGLNRY